MKKIKYIWNLEAPPRPKKWQVGLFSIMLCIGSFFWLPWFGFLVTSCVIGLIYLLKTNLLSEVLFRMTFTLYAVIHLTNLVILSLIFYFVFTTIGIVARILNKKFLTIDFDDQRDSFFKKGDPIEQDHFLRPY